MVLVLVLKKYNYYF